VGRIKLLKNLKGMSLQNNLQKEMPRFLKVSMTIAFIGGIITPLLETIRRWDQISDLHYFMSWFDDYLIGGFLIFSAVRTYKDWRTGHKYLIASWGFANGMIFYSFFGQLQMISSIDPAPVSSGTVLFIKGIMLVTCITSLILTLASITSRSR
jgi:hypothetical protein